MTVGFVIKKFVLTWTIAVGGVTVIVPDRRSDTRGRDNEFWKEGAVPNPVERKYCPTVPAGTGEGLVPLK